MKFSNVDVEIKRHRWDLYITIKDGEKIQKYVASADSYFDGIFFGTEKEYETARWGDID